jgi:hypothetical protein
MKIQTKKSKQNQKMKEMSRSLFALLCVLTSIFYKILQFSKYFNKDYCYLLKYNILRISYRKI